jgi:hypothetical protein
LVFGISLELGAFGLGWKPTHGWGVDAAGKRTLKRQHSDEGLFFARASVNSRYEE